MASACARHEDMRGTAQQRDRVQGGSRFLADSNRLEQLERQLRRLGGREVAAQRLAERKERGVPVRIRHAMVRNSFI